VTTAGNGAQAASPLAVPTAPCRTVEEVRERLLKRLNGAILHPGMYGGNGPGAEIVLLNVLGDLAFIDGCNEELSALRATLQRRQSFGPSGVCVSSSGPLCGRTDLGTRQRWRWCGSVVRRLRKPAP